VSELTRRELLRMLGTAVATSAVPLTAVEVGLARQRADLAVVAAGPAYLPRWFTPHEYRTVRLLVDLILPRDERSGSATDAGVPEFMDFLLGEREETAATIRGGLAWLDRECYERHGTTFRGSNETQRTGLLDLIAWPAKAPPELSQGVAFFNAFRDLTAAGFWSSKIGVADLEYRGNTGVAEWSGCPPEALEKLGVRYER
jgi:gluconate 2-dehydrogenase gamma chain